MNTINAKWLLVVLAAILILAAIAIK